MLPLLLPFYLARVLKKFIKEVNDEDKTIEINLNINLVVDYNDDNEKIDLSENGTWSDNENIDVPENGPFSGIFPVLTPMANGKLIIIKIQKYVN